MSIDDELALAQEIRRVDGQHNKGAAALAEALMPWLAEHDREKDDRIEALEAEQVTGYTAMMRKAINRAVDAEARLARVKAMHPRDEHQCECGEVHPATCGYCGENWPCPTIRALEGTTDE